jgi:N-acetylglutamate synthase-like GNAT family acetyltransferase
MSEIQLRPATRSDANVIRQMIFRERLNPVSLDWRHFILAVAKNDQVIGSVQVKPHADGTRELASLVVLTEFRGQHYAHRLIEAVLARETGPLYLTCRASLEPFYNRFGFKSLPDADLTPYFRRLTRLVRILKRIVPISENLAVMRREKG